MAFWNLRLGFCILARQAGTRRHFARRFGCAVAYDRYSAFWFASAFCFSSTLLGSVGQKRQVHFCVHFWVWVRFGSALLLHGYISTTRLALQVGMFDCLVIL